LNDNISDKDKKDWENFLSNKEKLPNKDINFFEKKKQIVKSIDLHGCTLIEANKKIESIINKSYLEGVNKLIVITGKGIHSKNESDPFVSKDLSILKYSVPEFIKNNKDLMKKINEFKDADIKDGGQGAFYIYFKKIK
tara:strand:+ start:410 stop:823 length:414 start_codon:yes stop_codon:yes gene_type:complete